MYCVYVYRIWNDNENAPERVHQKGMTIFCLHNIIIVSMIHVKEYYNTLESNEYITMNINL